MTQKNKSDWIDPIIKDLGEAKDLIKGVPRAQIQKYLDQAINSLLTI